MQRVKTGWTWAALMGLSMLASFLGLAILAGPANASEVDMLIEKLAQKGLLTRIEAETMRGDIEMAEKASYIKHREESNPWLDGLTQKGDIRLRYEAFSRESRKVASGNTSDTADRNRYRARVRWGVEKQFDSEWKAGFRLATGTANDATSTNQTLTDEFGLKSILLDQAYATWTPTGRVKDLLPSTKLTEIGAGKVNNPFAKTSTSIIWDGDVNPEGIYEKIDFNLGKTDTGYTDLNFLFGQFVVDEDSDLSPGDQGMMAYGVGVTHEWAKDHKADFHVTYYDWQDYIGFAKGGGSALPNPLGGNDRELEDLKILNFFGSVNFISNIPMLGNQNVKVFGDVAVNTAAQDYESLNGAIYDAQSTNTPRNDEDMAFSIGTTIGKAKDPGTWEAGYEYYYVEANAVNGAFSESDLGLGGTNNRGHKLSYKYMIHKNIELNFSAWIVERINTTIETYFTSGDNDVFGDDNQILRTQADLVYKF
jgi:hypothetical protein